VATMPFVRCDTIFFTVSETGLDDWALSGRGMQAATIAQTRKRFMTKSSSSS
jgi:hypothetical protein